MRKNPCIPVRAVTSTFGHHVPSEDKNKEPYLDGNSLVVFETTKSVLSFQRVSFGILRRVEGSRG